MPHPLLLHVRAHRQHPDRVGVVQIVFQVELVEVQRDDERRELWWEKGRAEEGEGEIRSVLVLVVQLALVGGERWGGEGIRTGRSACDQNIDVARRRRGLLGWVSGYSHNGPSISCA